VLSGYETPRRVPLLNRMFFGDLAPNGQASVRRRSASTPPPSDGMQSREEERPALFARTRNWERLRGFRFPGVGTISPTKARGERYDD
jgi:hypothetical protein